MNLDLQKTVEKNLSTKIQTRLVSVLSLGCSLTLQNIFCNCLSKWEPLYCASCSASQYERPSLLRSAWKETYRAHIQTHWSLHNSLWQRQQRLSGEPRGFLPVCTGFNPLPKLPVWRCFVAASTCTRKQLQKLPPRCCWVLQPPGDSEKWEADVNQHVGASGMPRHRERLRDV